jgi:hypothetical protein
VRYTIVLQNVVTGAIGNQGYMESVLFLATACGSIIISA